MINLLFKKAKKKNSKISMIASVQLLKYVFQKVHTIVYL